MVTRNVRNASTLALSAVLGVLLVALAATGANGETLVANWRLDESSGNAVCDVNAAYNGTLTGSPTQGAAGKIGTAYTLNGSNYVTPGGPPTPSSAMTISAWVNPTTTGQYGYCNFVHWNQGGNDIQWSTSPDSGMRYGQWGSNSGNFSTGANFVPLNAWTNVVLVRNGTSVVLYANGSLAGSGTVPVPTYTPTVMHLGWGAGNNLVGSLDDVALWSSALSVGKVGTLGSVLAANSGALNDYNALRMNQLFTAYDTSTPQSVTSSAGTLTWTQFTGGSGTAGTVTYGGGVYRAFFDGTSGVTATVTAEDIPEPATMGLVVFGLAGLSRYARRRR